MAEDNDPSGKTEEPTPRRLEEARRKGDVAKSPDVGQWASLAGAAGVLAIMGGWIARDVSTRLLPFVERPESFSLQGGGSVAVARLAMLAGAPALIIVLGAAAVSGVAGNLIQHGFLWSPSKLAFDPKRISPGAGFKRLFGVDGFMQFLKSALKVILVGVVAWMVIKPHASEVTDLAGLDLSSVMSFSSDLLRRLVMAVLVVTGVFAGLDWFWRRHRFMAQMKMSREELKEDSRQSEGDPHVRARQRQIRMERARRRMIQAVPTATVVVVNPTHYAVALRYESGETAAPVCVAKGLDLVALRIREAAEKAEVPVVEDPPLARALYGAVEVDQTIPVAHYEAVAKVIGFVMGGARKARV